MTVKELRENGYKVRITHRRKIGRKYMNRALFEAKYAGTKCWVDEVKPYGGQTIVEVTDPNGQTVLVTAQCQAEENYNKRLGVSIALGRALKRLSTASEESE